MAEASVTEAVYALRYSTGDSVSQLTRARQAAEQLVGSTDKLATSEERLGKSSLNMLASLDPRIRAEQTAAKQLEHFSRLHADGAITVGRYASSLKLVESNLKTKVSAMDGAVSTTSRLGDRIGALVTRYVGLIAIMNAARRLAQEAIRTDVEAAAAVDRLGLAYTDLAKNLAPTIAMMTDWLTGLVVHTNNVVKGIKDAAAEIGRAPILGGAGNFLGPLGAGTRQSGFAGLDSKSKNWTPGPFGFPESGVTDLTPGMEKAQKAAADAAKDFADTFAKGEQAARESQSNLIASLAKSQSESIKKIWEDESAWKSQMLKESIERQNAAGQAIIEINKETAEASKEFWDDFNEHQKRLTDERYEAQVKGADRLRMSLMEVGTAGLYGFRSLGEAAAGFLEQIAVMIFQMKVLKPIIESIGGSFGTSGGGGIFGAIAGALGGALTGVSSESGAMSGLLGMATGGPVSGGTSYLVGERGPELFTPRSAGTITPNHQMGGGGTVINIDARGSTLSEAQIEAAFMRSVHASVGISLGTIAKNRKDTGRG